jgi:hypothetical protein
MALISLLLGLKSKSLGRFAGGFEAPRFPVYDQRRSVGIQCANRNCIVHEPMEAQYVRNKFHIIRPDTPTESKIRCLYCESDIETFVVASKKNKWYSTDPATLARLDDHHLREFVIFAKEADAVEAGFHPRRSEAEPGGSPREGAHSARS